MNSPDSRLRRLGARFFELTVPWLVATFACATTAVGQTDGDTHRPDASFSVLVFSKTAGFRHASIPDGVEAIRNLGREHGFRVEATEDSDVFISSLDRHAVVLFLSTTGDVLDDTQQRVFEAYVRRGGGYVGVHAASDTEYEWPWYGRLVGAYFKSHPRIQDAEVVVEDLGHPSTRHLSPRWPRRDEWYDYHDNPREDVHVLATVDEKTYEGGRMGDDHPIAWCHEFEGGRVWYTGGGHTKESFTEPAFVQHMLGGIYWAARRDLAPADVTGASSRPADADADFEPLFDGTTLDGWRKVGGGATYHVDDGCIVGTVGPGANTFLRTERTFADFELTLEVKLDEPGNSGIQFRSHQRENDGRVYGYQCEIDPSPRAWSGGVYDEGRRGWLASLEDREAARAAFRAEGWNRYVIRAVGPRIQTWVNGVPCADLTDDADAEGFIALQVHSGKAGRIRWRHMRIREW